MMARKKKNREADEMDMDEERRGGGLIGALIGLIIVIIWLLIFALLVKMDVGGFGTNVMRPLIKDVPVINKILPEVSDDEVAAETGYKYKTLYDAMERIKELEAEITGYQENANANAETIAELQAEISRLKVYEQQQLEYIELKKKFDEEVVFNDKAVDINEYKIWYESIDPENAALIYQQVIEKISYSEQVQEWAKTYSKMDAASAAAILEEMTGDLDLVTAILLNMNATQRAEVLAAMDTVFAAKLTNVMYPAE